MSTLREMGDGELVGMYTERKRNTVDCSRSVLAQVLWHINDLYTERNYCAKWGLVYTARN